MEPRAVAARPAQEPRRQPRPQADHRGHEAPAARPGDGVLPALQLLAQAGTQVTKLIQRSIDANYNMAEIRHTYTSCGATI